MLIGHANHDCLVQNNDFGFEVAARGRKKEVLQQSSECTQKTKIIIIIKKKKISFSEKDKWKRRTKKRQT